MRALLVDCLGTVRGSRPATLDVIGAGPRAIAGALEHLGCNVSVITPREVLRARRAMRNYDLLLLSAMSTDLAAAWKVARIWRELNGGKPILLGGPACADPIRALERVDCDLCVIGEGEWALMELWSSGLSEGSLPGRESLSSIRGIAFKVEGSSPILTGLRPASTRQELSELPLPSWRALRGYPFYWACRVYVEVARGCSNYYRTQIPLPDGRACTGCDVCRSGPLRARYYCPEGIPPGCGYCSVPSLFGPSRSHAVGRVKADVEGLVKAGARRIVLSASDVLDFGRDLLVEPEPLTNPREPPANIDALEELFKAVFSIGEVARGDVVVMLENLKPCLVSPEVAELLGRYFEGTPVSIGIETGSERHSRLLGRPSGPKEAIRAIRLLRKAGLRPQAYFIHGLPGQDEQTVAATLKVMEEAVRAGAEHIILYRFRSLPMSAFGDFPSGPPATRDPLSAKLVERARELNEALKARWVGRRVEVVVACEHPRKKGYLVAYPMRHGPVVLLKGSEGLVGAVLEVRVEGVISERLVLGAV